MAKLIVIQHREAAAKLLAGPHEPEDVVLVVRRLYYMAKIGRFSFQIDRLELLRLIGQASRDDGEAKVRLIAMAFTDCSVSGKEVLNLWIWSP